MARVSRNQRLERLIDRVGSTISELKDIRSDLWGLLPRKKLPPNSPIAIFIQDAVKRFKKARALERKLQRQASKDSNFLESDTWSPRIGETLRIRLPNDYEVKK